MLWRMKNTELWKGGGDNWTFRSWKVTFISYTGFIPHSENLQYYDPYILVMDKVLYLMHHVDDIVERTRELFDDEEVLGVSWHLAFIGSWHWIVSDEFFYRVIDVRIFRWVNLVQKIEFRYETWSSYHC